MMMKLLHSIVGTTPPQRLGRARLLAAILARDQAMQQVMEAREKLERLESVVNLSDNLARKAAADTRAANDFRAAWVGNGCRHSEYRELQVLDDGAAESARAAERAARDASVVGKELARAESLLRDAQSALRSAEAPIANAIATIIVEEEKQKFARLQALLVELPEAWLEVLAIQQLINPWSRASDGVHGSDATYAVVSPVLEHGAEVLRSLGREIDRYSAHPLFERVEQRKITLRARAAQLRENPDAE